MPAPSWALRKARGKLRSQPMTSPVERISGPSSGSTPGKRAKGRTASLTENHGVCGSASVIGSISGSGSSGPVPDGVGRAEGEVRQRLAGHQAGGDRGDGAVGGLGDEGHGAAGAGVDLEHVDVVALDGELHVHQADDAEGEGHGAGLDVELGDDLGRERVGRQRAGAVAGMHAGLLDVLHDAGDVDVRAVAEGVDVDFGGVGEVAVEQDRGVAGDLDGGGDVAGELGVVADDLHGAAAEHVAGADHQRVADAGGDGLGLLGRAGDAVGGLAAGRGRCEQLLEALAVLGEVDGVGRGAEDRDAGVVQRVGELQRGLAAELDDDAVQRAVRPARRAGSRGRARG